MNKINISIPMPLLVLIEDVGWWKGEDGSKFNEPFRTGMPRDHVPEDYAALAALGRELDMKILAGFVLGEWDRHNILRNLPSSTWMGKNWTAPYTDPEQKIKAAWIIKNAQNHIELGVHGLCHEFWDQGVMQRSEFHDTDCTMRDSDEIRRHLSYFFRILDQYQFCQTPGTFIPPALKHSFGDPDNGFQKILAEFGIDSVILVFKRTKLYSSPQTEKIAWENNVLLVERGELEIPWNKVAAAPEFRFDRPILALHWSNILHPDPETNPWVIQKWAEFIKTGSEENGMLPAKDKGECLNQYCHHIMSEIKRIDDGFSIDLGWREKIPASPGNLPIYLKVDAPAGTQFDITGAKRQPCLRASEKSFLKLAVSGMEKKIIIRPRKLI